MKSCITFFLVTLAALAAKAQIGTIVYTETMKLEIHLEGMGPDMENMLPKESTSKHELYYSPEASLYVNSSETADQEVNEEMAGGGMMMIKMQQPDEKLFVDFKNQQVTEQREFMSRMFLIEAPVDSTGWKLTGNQREILGFQCMEAVSVKDTNTTIAWFTPAIPVAGGPSDFIGLPGLILEVNVNNGKRIIAAASVNAGNVADRIVKPKKGRKVTREEFKSIVEEKTGEQQGEGGATFMIKIRQD